MASEWESFKYSLSRRHSNPSLLSQAIKSDKTLPQFIRIFTLRILKEVSVRGSLDRYNPLSLFNVPYEISVKFADTYIDDPEVLNDYIEWFKLTHSDIKYYDKLEDRFRKVFALSRLPYWAFWSILSRRALVEEMILKNNSLHGITWDNLTLLDEHALEIMIGNAAATPDPLEWIVATFNDVSRQYPDVSEVLQDMSHGQQMQLLRCLQGPFIWQWLGRGGSIHEFDAMPRQVLLRAPPYAILRNSGRTYHKTSSARPNGRFNVRPTREFSPVKKKRAKSRSREALRHSNGINYDGGSSVGVFSNTQKRYKEDISMVSAVADLKNYRSYNDRGRRDGNNNNNNMSHDVKSRRRSRRRGDERNDNSSNCRESSPNDQLRKGRANCSGGLNKKDTYSVRSGSIRRRRKPSPVGRNHSPSPVEDSRKRRSITPVRFRHHSRDQKSEDSSGGENTYPPKEEDHDNLDMEAVYPLLESSDSGDICGYPCCGTPSMPQKERTDTVLNVPPELGETWFLNTCKTNTGLGTAGIGVIHRNMSS